MNKTIEARRGLDEAAVEALQSLQREFTRNRKVGLRYKRCEYRCACGNPRNDESGCPLERGFSFCDAAGNDLPGDSEYERCEACGRVIHLYTIVSVNRVVAHRPELVFEEDHSTSTLSDAQKPQKN